MAGVLVDGSSQLTELKERVIQLAKEGLARAEIISQTGVNPKTVGTWLRRNGLVKPKQDSKESQPDKPQVGHYSQEIRTKLAKKLDALASKVEALPEPKGKRAIKDQAELCTAVAQPSALVCGWSTTGAQTVVNIAALMSAQVVQPDVTDVPPATAQVIDVEQSPGTIEEKASFNPVPPPQ